MRNWLIDYNIKIYLVTCKGEQFLKDTLLPQLKGYNKFEEK